MFGPFIVHNTIQATGQKLDVTKQIVNRSATAIKRSGVPHSGSILYGDIYIVGQIKSRNTLAWWNKRSDDVYVRAFTRFSVDAAHSLMHELGHRLWNRFLTGSIKHAWLSHHDMLKVHAPYPVMPKPGDIIPVDITGRSARPVIDRIEQGMIYLKGGGQVKADRLLDFLRKQNSEDAYPTKYAATDAEEHFCEAFAMYCLGTLSEQHQSAFKRIVMDQDQSAFKVAVRHMGSRT